MERLRYRVDDDVLSQSTMEGFRMSSIRSWMAGVCALPAIAMMAFAAPPVAALDKAPAAPRELRVGRSGFPTFVRPEPQTRLGPRAATFQVTYSGFSPPARAAFQRAVNIWAQRINSPVPITVSASFQPLDPGILGSAGASLVHRDFLGAPRPATWYVDALANKLSGGQRDPSPDIVARFSSAFPNWHFGTGPAPANTFDFTTVVLHEIGHGLGFLGAGFVSGSTGTVRLSGFPIIYDRFTENGAGRSLLTFPDPSTALGTQLRSNNLFFDSPQVRTANGGARAKLYAPTTFRPGSSYSHLDEATFPRGNANSLMTPFLGQGETIRRPGAITLALFATLGW
jgi:hypothetical protein